MDKKRNIDQFNFNDNLNGYLLWSDDYYTSVNDELVGLDNYHTGKLFYFIR